MLAKIQNAFRLTRDAELRYSQSGTAILNLGLACSEKYKDKEKQLFLDATAFGKPAELINQYSGRKGMQISLAGKLETQQWVDNNGAKKSKVALIIEDFEFLNNNKGDNQGSAAPQQQGQPQYEYQGANGQPMSQEQYQKQQASQAPQQQAPSAEQVPEIDIDEDEIPF